MSNFAPDKIKFAIVGAGCAGIYAAWRLAASGERNIRVFETDGRVGGRLLTAQMPNAPFRVELGGMRYTSRQLLVSKLVQRLGLKSKPFRFQNQIYHLRGQRFSWPAEVARLPYGVTSLEKHKGPAHLVIDAIKRCLGDIELCAYKGSATELKDSIAAIIEQLRVNPSPLTFKTLQTHAWTFLKRNGLLKGSQLYQTGFWNILFFYLSPEAFLFAHDGLGYESVLANWNAGEALPWFVRDFDSEYETLVDGMDALPNSLASEFEVYCPDSMSFDHELVEVSPDSGARATRLTFVIGRGTKKETKTVLAESVFLALPQLALRRVKFGYDLSDVEGEIDSVTAHPLFKLFLGYETCWWSDPRALGSESGRSTTDLPIRQVYYFGPDKADEALCASNSKDAGKAMLMASYNDSHYVDFWKPLIQREGRGPYYGHPRALTTDEKRVLRSFGATENMVRKASKQISLLHPSMLGIPDPYVGLTMEWPQGWHTWNVHINPFRAMHKLKRPFDANIFVCGEAYSCEQGWVEGALRSAELALAELGLSPPDWVTEPAFRNEGFTGFHEYICRG